MQHIEPVLMPYKIVLKNGKSVFIALQLPSILDFDEFNRNNLIPLGKLRGEGLDIEEPASEDLYQKPSLIIKIDNNTLNILRNKDGEESNQLIREMAGYIRGNYSIIAEPLTPSKHYKSEVKKIISKHESTHVELKADKEKATFNQILITLQSTLFTDENLTTWAKHGSVNTRVPVFNSSGLLEFKEYKLPEHLAAIIEQIKAWHSNLQDALVTLTNISAITIHAVSVKPMEFKFNRQTIAEKVKDPSYISSPNSENERPHRKVYASIYQALNLESLKEQSDLQIEDLTVNKLPGTRIGTSHVSINKVGSAFGKILSPNEALKTQFASITNPDGSTHLKSKLIESVVSSEILSKVKTQLKTTPPFTDEKQLNLLNTQGEGFRILKNKLKKVQKPSDAKDDAVDKIIKFLIANGDAKATPDTIKPLLSKIGIDPASLSSIEQETIVNLVTAYQQAVTARIQSIAEEKKQEHKQQPVSSPSIQAASPAPSVREETERAAADEERKRKEAAEREKKEQEEKAHLEQIREAERERERKKEADQAKIFALAKLNTGTVELASIWLSNIPKDSPSYAPDYKSQKFRDAIIQEAKTLYDTLESLANELDAKQINELGGQLTQIYSEKTPITISTSEKIKTAVTDAFALFLQNTLSQIQEANSSLKGAESAFREQTEREAKIAFEASEVQRSKAISDAAAQYELRREQERKQRAAEEEKRNQLIEQENARKQKEALERFAREQKEREEKAEQKRKAEEQNLTASIVSELVKSFAADSKFSSAAPFDAEKLKTQFLEHGSILMKLGKQNINSASEVAAILIPLFKEASAEAIQNKLLGRGISNSSKLAKTIFDSEPAGAYRANLALLAEEKRVANVKEDKEVANQSLLNFIQKLQSDIDNLPFGDAKNELKKSIAALDRTELEKALLPYARHYIDKDQKEPQPIQKATAELNTLLSSKIRITKDGKIINEFSTPLFISYPIENALTTALNTFTIATQKILTETIRSELQKQADRERKEHEEKERQVREEKQKAKEDKAEQNLKTAIQELITQRVNKIPDEKMEGYDGPAARNKLNDDTNTTLLTTNLLDKIKTPEARELLADKLKTLKDRHAKSERIEKDAVQAALTGTDPNALAEVLRFTEFANSEMGKALLAKTSALEKQRLEAEERARKAAAEKAAAELKLQIESALTFLGGVLSILKTIAPFTADSDFKTLQTDKIALIIQQITPKDNAQQTAKVLAGLYKTQVSPVNDAKDALKAVGVASPEDQQALAETMQILAIPALQAQAASISAGPVDTTTSASPGIILDSDTKEDKTMATPRSQALNKAILIAIFGQEVDITPEFKIEMKEDDLAAAASYDTELAAIQLPSPDFTQLAGLKVTVPVELITAATRRHQLINDKDVPKEVKDALAKINLAQGKTLAASATFDQDLVTLKNPLAKQAELAEVLEHLGLDKGLAATIRPEIKAATPPPPAGPTPAEIKAAEEKKIATAKQVINALTSLSPFKELGASESKELLKKLAENKVIYDSLSVLHQELKDGTNPPLAIAMRLIEIKGNDSQLNNGNIFNNLPPDASALVKEVNQAIIAAVKKNEEKKAADETKAAEAKVEEIVTRALLQLINEVKTATNDELITGAKASTPQTAEQYFNANIQQLKNLVKDSTRIKDEKDLVKILTKIIITPDTSQTLTEYLVTETGFNKGKISNIQNLIINLGQMQKKAQEKIAADKQKEAEAKQNTQMLAELKEILKKPPHFFSLSQVETFVTNNEKSLIALKNQIQNRDADPTKQAPQIASVLIDIRKKNFLLVEKLNKLTVANITFQKDWANYVPNITTNLITDFNSTSKEAEEAAFLVAVKAELEKKEPYHTKKGMLTGLDAKKSELFQLQSQLDSKDAKSPPNERVAGFLLAAASKETTPVTKDKIYEGTKFSSKGSLQSAVGTFYPIMRDAYVSANVAKYKDEINAKLNKDLANAKIPSLTIDDNILKLLVDKPEYKAHFNKIDPKTSYTDTVNAMKSLGVDARQAASLGKVIVWQPKAILAMNPMLDAKSHLKEADFTMAGFATKLSKDKDFEDIISLIQNPIDKKSSELKTEILKLGLADAKAEEVAVAAVNAYRIRLLSKVGIKDLDKSPHLATLDSGDFKKLFNPASSADEIKAIVRSLEGKDNDVLANKILLELRKAELLQVVDAIPELKDQVDIIRAIQGATDLHEAKNFTAAIGAIKVKTNTAAELAAPLAELKVPTLIDEIPAAYRKKEITDELKGIPVNDAITGLTEKKKLAAKTPTEVKDQLLIIKKADSKLNDVKAAMDVIGLKNDGDTNATAILKHTREEVIKTTLNATLKNLGLPPEASITFNAGIPEPDNGFAAELKKIASPHGLTQANIVTILTNMKLKTPDPNTIAKQIFDNLPYLKDLPAEVKSIIVKDNVIGQIPSELKVAPKSIVLLEALAGVYNKHLKSDPDDGKFVIKNLIELVAADLAKSFTPIKEELKQQLIVSLTEAYKDVKSLRGFLELAGKKADEYNLNEAAKVFATNLKDAVKIPVPKDKVAGYDEKTYEEKITNAALIAFNAAISPPTLTLSDDQKREVASALNNIKLPLALSDDKAIEAELKAKGVKTVDPILTTALVQFIAAGNKAKVEADEALKKAKNEAFLSAFKTELEKGKPPFETKDAVQLINDHSEAILKLGAKLTPSGGYTHQAYLISALKGAFGANSAAAIQNSNLKNYVSDTKDIDQKTVDLTKAFETALKKASEMDNAKSALETASNLFIKAYQDKMQTAGPEIKAIGDSAKLLFDDLQKKLTPVAKTQLATALPKLTDADQSKIKSTFISESKGSLADEFYAKIARFNDNAKDLITKAQRRNTLLQTIATIPALEKLESLSKEIKEAAEIKDANSADVVVLKNLKATEGELQPVLTRLGLNPNLSKDIINANRKHIILTEVFPVAVTGTTAVAALQHAIDDKSVRVDQAADFDNNISIIKTPTSTVDEVKSALGALKLPNDDAHVYAILAHTRKEAILKGIKGVATDSTIAIADVDLVNKGETLAKLDKAIFEENLRTIIDPTKQVREIQTALTGLPDRAKDILTTTRQYTVIERLVAASGTPIPPALTDAKRVDLFNDISDDFDFKKALTAIESKELNRSPEAIEVLLKALKIQNAAANQIARAIFNNLSYIKGLPPEVRAIFEVKDAFIKDPTKSPKTADILKELVNTQEKLLKDSVSDPTAKKRAIGEAIARAFYTDISTSPATELIAAIEKSGIAQDSILSTVNKEALAILEFERILKAAQEDKNKKIYENLPQVLTEIRDSLITKLKSLDVAQQHDYADSVIKQLKQNSPADVAHFVASEKTLARKTEMKFHEPTMTRRTSHYLETLGVPDATIKKVTSIIVADSIAEQERLYWINKIENKAIRDKLIAEGHKLLPDAKDTTRSGINAAKVMEKITYLNNKMLENPQDAAVIYTQIQGLLSGVEIEPSKTTPIDSSSLASITAAQRDIHRLRYYLSVNAQDDKTPEGKALNTAFNDPKVPAIDPSQKLKFEYHNIELYKILASRGLALKEKNELKPDDLSAVRELTLKESAGIMDDKHTTAILNKEGSYTDFVSKLKAVLKNPPTNNEDIITEKEFNRLKDLRKAEKLSGTPGSLKQLINDAGKQNKHLKGRLESIEPTIETLKAKVGSGLSELDRQRVTPDLEQRVISFSTQINDHHASLLTHYKEMKALEEYYLGHIVLTDSVFGGKKVDVEKSKEKLKNMGFDDPSTRNRISATAADQFFELREQIKKTEEMLDKFDKLKEKTMAVSRELNIGKQEKLKPAEERSVSSYLNLEAMKGDVILAKTDKDGYVLDAKGDRTAQKREEKIEEWLKTTPTTPAKIPAFGATGVDTTAKDLKNINANNFHLGRMECKYGKPGDEFRWAHYTENDNHVSKGSVPEGWNIADCFEKVIIGAGVKYRDCLNTNSRDGDGHPTQDAWKGLFQQYVEQMLETNKEVNKDTLVSFLENQKKLGVLDDNISSRRITTGPSIDGLASTLMTAYEQQFTHKYTLPGSGTLRDKKYILPSPDIAALAIAEVKGFVESMKAKERANTSTVEGEFKGTYTLTSAWCKEYAEAVSLFCKANNWKFVNSTKWEIPDKPSPEKVEAFIHYSRHNPTIKARVVVHQQTIRGDDKSEVKVIEDLKSAADKKWHRPGPGSSTPS